MPGAASDDTFETVTLYDEVYSSDIEKFPGRGPELRPGGRYVIFALMDRKNSGFAADWFITLTCELD